MPDPVSLIGKKIVVIGGRGFIGARLVRVLAERENASVVVVVRSTRHNPWRDLGNVKLVKGVGSTTASFIAEAYAVVNLAYDFASPGRELIQDFERLLLECVAAGVKSFIQFSSIAVYDDWPGGQLTEASPADGPGSVYKLTKREMERRLAASTLPHTILQPTIVYGAGSTLWTEKIFDKLRSGVVVLPDGEEGLCHAVHVDDVVDATVGVIRQATHLGERYIISGPEPVGWRTFYEVHAKLVGKPAPRLETLQATPSRVPIASGRAAKPALSLLRFIRSIFAPKMIAFGKRVFNSVRYGGRPIVHRPSLSDLVLLRARGSCSIARAQREIGYQPKIDLDAGMLLIAESRRR